MVLRVIWTRKALEDLRVIDLGRRVPEFPDELWREVLTGNYRIIYRTDSEGQRVFILAVAHGMQILRASMIVPV